MEDDRFTRIEAITRGVCVKQGKILLCFGKKAAITYLPGGHIEFRETGRYALEREIKEELGVESKAGAFLGVCEHSFIQKGEPHAEINLVFALDIPSLSPDEPAEAKEGWIGFRWAPLAELDAARLEPAALRPLLAAWLRKPGGHVAAGSEWVESPLP